MCWVPALLLLLLQQPAAAASCAVSPAWGAARSDGRIEVAVSLRSPAQGAVHTAGEALSVVVDLSNFDSSSHTLCIGVFSVRSTVVEQCGLEVSADGQAAPMQLSNLETPGFHTIAVSVRGRATADTDVSVGRLEVGGLGNIALSEGPPLGAKSLTLRQFQKQINHPFFFQEKKFPQTSCDFGPRF